MSATPEFSFVCPVTRESADLARVHAEFLAVARDLGRSAEFLYVVDGPLAHVDQELDALDAGPFPVRILRMAKGFGEATALQIGFLRARGRFVITLPNCLQIDAATLRDVVAALDRGRAAVVTRRHPRSDAWLNRLQSSVFHGLVRRLVGRGFHDMTCGLRGFRVEAARRLELYGDQHRFIPVIAMRAGYPVEELPGRQHPDNRRLRLWGPGVYVRRLLDILTIYFLVRFTRKPLRFFGLIGLMTGGVGAAITGWLGVERLLGATALADRPLLLLGVLLLVLGVQLTSIGLIGEIIIFLAARREMPEADELEPAGAEPAAVRRDGV